MSGGLILPPPDAGHSCPLPHRSGGYGSTGHPDGVVFICSECGAEWISRPCFESYGPTSVWKPVRWWHFSARRRIAEARS